MTSTYCVSIHSDRRCNISAGKVSLVKKLGNSEGSRGLLASEQEFK